MSAPREDAPGSSGSNGGGIISSGSLTMNMGRRTRRSPSAAGGSWTCRCLNLMWTDIELQPQDLPSGTPDETAALEALRIAERPAHPYQQRAQTPPAAAVPATDTHPSVQHQSSPPPVFPDGFRVGRLCTRITQHVALLHVRPHPRQSLWRIARCLNCGFDAYATCAGHADHDRLVVTSAKAHHADDTRRWRDSEHFSRTFGVLVRHTQHQHVTAAGHAAQTSSALGSASPMPEGTSGTSTPTNSLQQPHASPLASSAAMHELRTTMDRALEADRVAMETRLSQMRAVEESRFAETEHRVRQQFATLIAQVEREYESGLVGQPPDGISPRIEARNRRGSSPRDLSGDLTSVDSAASALLSPGSDASGASRSNHRGASGYHSSTPPSASALTDEQQQQRLAEQKALASTIAIPLDLTQAAPATPNQSYRRSLIGTLSTKPTLGAIGATRNADFLPASPRLGAQAAEEDDEEDGPASSGRVGTTIPPPVDVSSAHGIALVPFDEEGSPGTSQFDGFVLPPAETGAGRHTGKPSADGGIFQLDGLDDGSSSGEASPQTLEGDGARMDDANGDDEDDSDGELLASEDEPEETEGGLSEEADEDVDEPQISSKALRLLGVGTSGDSLSIRDRPASGSTGGSSHRIIRPSTSSGGTGNIIMVQMSLPVAIPKQLMAKQTGAAKERTEPARQAVASSALGRSLRAHSQRSDATPAAATAAASSGAAVSSHRPSTSFSDSDSESASGAADDDDDDEAVFVPPHTLMERTFARGGHIGSIKDRPDLIIRQPQTQTATAHSVVSPPAAFGSPTSPLASLPLQPFVIPLSSSVPRMAGPLGRASSLHSAATAVSQQSGPSARAAGVPHLGLGAPSNSPPAASVPLNSGATSSTGGPRGPSSRAAR